MDLDLIDPEMRRAARIMPAPPVHHRWTLPVMRWLTKIGTRHKLSSGVTVEVRPVGAASVHIYRPPVRTSDGAVLWIHGGGFVIGAASIDDVRCSRYALEFGVTVVSVDYRLAPEHPFPAPLDDCFAGWTWVQERADGLGVDPHRIVVGGESAGGGLAATLVQRIHDTGGPQPAAQLLVYPMLDDRTAARTELDAVKHRLWNNRANRAGWTAYLGHEPGGPGAGEDGTGHDGTAKPGTAKPGTGESVGGRIAEYAVGARRSDLAGLPPAWIGVGEVDLFHDEDRDYAERLVAAGVPCELVVVPGAPHGFVSTASKATATVDFERRIDEFLRTCLSRVPDANSNPSS
ncbi:MAG: alpha/beta hydrolase [Ilumatobacteraceae bacterium]